MGLRINQNIAAMNAYRNLSVNDGAMSKSLEKLSSGFRINRAADDAAGLSVSEGLRSQIGGLKVAVRNAQDGISVVQTAEGALTETTSILQRMRDLAVQAANGGSQDANAQGAAQTEFGQLQTELDRIANTTSFGSQKLLSGSYNGGFQVGANNTANDQINVDLGKAVFGTAVAGVTGTSAAAVVGSGAVAVTTGGAGNLSLSIDGTSFDVAVVSGDTGATLAAKIDTAAQTALGTTATGYATEASGTLSLHSLTTGGSSSVAVNSSSTAATLTATKLTAASNTGTAEKLASATGFTSDKLGVGSSVKLSDTDSAKSAIDHVDNAIKNVSTARATMGAYQNRFEHTINNLNVAVENLSASESRIRDTDMAQEMVQFTRSQILSQAGTAMLAQANSAPQSVLQLLRG